jgi:2-hydroxy-4-carboxymuconate semialdehyde hemiacetal dehydrogenase
MNVCLVGHGMMGTWHTNALARSDAHTHTLVGRREEATSAFAEAYGYERWTTSLEEALADDAVDAVILTTPSETHADSTLLALRSGKPVLVEIPLAMSLPDAERVVQEAARQHVPLGVVHPLRAHPELTELRERIGTEEERVQQVVGRLYLHRVENVGSTGYRRSWTDNLLWHHMTHLVDAALWITGPANVSVQSAMSPVDPSTGVPMDAAILMQTEHGQPLLCSGSYYARERLFDLLVVTNRDSYRLDVFAETLTTAAGARPIDSEEANCWRLTHDFIAAVRDQRDPLVPGDSVLPAMRALATAQEIWDDRYGTRSLPGRPLP